MYKQTTNKIKSRVEKKHFMELKKKKKNGMKIYKNNNENLSKREKCTTK